MPTISLERTTLLEALVNVSRAAAVKSTMPVIEGIYMKVTRTAGGAGDVYLCCYNLDMGIATTVSAQADGDCAVVLPTRVCDFIRRLPGEKVTIEIDDRCVVKITSDNSDFEIVGMKPEDFPELPRVDGDYSFKLPQGLLRSMIAQTFYAISTSDVNPVYKGALFEANDGDISLIALDGYRLAVRNEEINEKGEFHFIVPGKTLGEVRQMLSDGDDAVEISPAKNNIIFIIGNYCIISRLFSGDFIDYRTTFTREYKYEARLKTSDLIAGVDRVALVNTETSRSPVRCTFGGGKLKMFCETPIGRVEDEIDCDCGFDGDIEIGFNNKYMQDAFKNVDCDEIILRILSGDKPVQVLPPDGESFLYLLLPVRLGASNG